MNTYCVLDGFFLDVVISFKDAKKKDELHLSSSFFVVVCFNFIQQLSNPSQ